MSRRAKPMYGRCLEGILGELELEETMPLKASEEVTQKVAREVPEPFIKEVSAFKDCKEGGYAKVEYEDNVPQVFPKVEEGDKA